MSDKNKPWPLESGSLSYMKSTSNAIKIRFTLFFVLFVTALFSIIIIMSVQQIQQAASVTVSIAGMPVLERAAAFIDGDTYERLIYTLDPSDPFFVETQAKFRELKEETHCLHLYTMSAYGGNIHRFIFDGERSDSEDFTPLGTEEDISNYSKTYLLTYSEKTPQFSQMMFQSQWGRLISAFMPILNSNGDVVGVIGVDFEADGIIKAIMTNVTRQIICALAFTAVGLFFYFFLIQDLTRQNNKLLEMSRRAETASRAKSNFLAKMSHEIRTPMNAITGMAELALREDLPGAAHEYILTIKQAGANLLSIINEILDFSKIESGKLEIVPGDYFLSSLLNDIISIVRIKVMDSPVRFVVNIDCNIPNSLYGDEIRIRQIFLNILSNAVKYTDEGYVSFAVTGETQGDTVKLSVEVTDSGKGMKQEDIQKLFGDFVQVDLSKNKGIEGTGLGLAIAHSLVKAMGGDIIVSSEYGVGSTFTVTLPQKIREHAKIASVENPQEKRVLIYELREIYAESIVCTIDNLGVNCTLVSTDAEFLEKISSGEYAFIFIASTLYESKNIREICGEVSKEAKTVILAGFGKAVAERNLSILAMPVSSISVANILNGVDDGFSYSADGEIVAMFTATDASVLVVDDINTNLSVAHGLLLPYKMRVDLCDSGADAIEAVKSARYDLVFMDHMMPEMDGVEAAARIRKLGASDAYYKNLPIIALTANAVSGAKEMFLEYGFNDFLSKPIDTIKLNTVLEKWIPKEKRIKSKAEIFVPPMAVGKDPKLLKIFRGDAEKAVVTLRETMARGDIKLFTTTAHAMKSALANIGESEISAAASALEKAGQNADVEYIAANAGSFTNALEMLVERLTLPEPTADSDTDVAEDTAYFSEQLSIIKEACENYDSKTAYAALDRLKEKPWKAEHAAALEQIRDLLFLQSDFEEAGNHAQILLSREGNYA